MNILFVSAVLPYPLHSGGQIRIYQLLKRLGTKHKITLCSFIRSEHEREYANRFPFCAGVRMVMRGRVWQPGYLLKASFGKYPLLLTSYDNAAMRKTIAGLLAAHSFDVLHAEPFYVWPSLPETSVPLVISEHNIEYDVYREFSRTFKPAYLRPVLVRDTEKIRHWEQVVWEKSKRITAVSRKDADVIESYTHRAVDIIPNGVDLSSFPFRMPAKTKKKTVLFVGNFRWLPNRESAEILVTRIYPGVKNAYPDARLSVIGKDMPAHLKNRITGLGGFAGDHVDDIQPYYRDADVLVAPVTIAGGTKFKMLEAMATGIPVVTTREGASGLLMENGKQYTQADTADSFTESILSLWKNPETARALAKRGRELVESKYSWNRIADDLEKTWKKAV